MSFLSDCRGGGRKDGEQEVPDLTGFLQMAGAGGSADPTLGVVAVVDREVAPPQTVIAPKVMAVIAGLDPDGGLHGIAVERHAPRGLLKHEGRRSVDETTAFTQESNCWFRLSPAHRKPSPVSKAPCPLTQGRSLVSGFLPADALDASRSDVSKKPQLGDGCNSLVCHNLVCAAHFIPDAFRWR